MNELGLKIIDVISSQDTNRGVFSADDRVLVDIADYPEGAKGVLYACSGHTGGGSNTIRTITINMRTELGISAIPGSSCVFDDGGYSVWGIGQSDPFTIPAGLQSFKFFATTNGTTEIPKVSKIELLIVI